MYDEQKLEFLMTEYGNSILRMCYLYLKDYQLAEDATQETFIKAMKSYDSFEHKSSEKTWITRIAINSCKNIMRTHWFKLLRNDSNNNVEPTIESFQIEDSIEKQNVSDAIMKLNSSDRQIILLYYYQCLSIKEISIIIGRNENTILQRLKRARTKLKNILTEVDLDEI